MLSEREKQELREMAGSEILREEFRALRRNSAAIERAITVDELAHWLTVMARLWPAPPNPRPPVHYTTVRF